VSEAMAASLGRTNTNGALVVEVTPTGPAEGIIEEGDIVLDFNGRAIVRMRDLPRFVAETAVGEKVTVTVLRDGSERSLDVTLGRLEDGEKIIAAAREPAPETTAPVTGPESSAPGLADLLGIEVGAIDDEAREAFDIGEGIDGVVITSVAKGSDAERQGLLAGLVISEVNQQPIASLADFAGRVDAAREAGRPAVLFKVTDPAGTNRFVAIKLAP